MTGIQFPVCVELVCYKPGRSSAKGHAATQYVIGITAWDRCSNCYRPIAEIDNDIPLEDLLRSWPPWYPKPVYIVRTRKGYHLIMDGCYENPTKLMRILTKWKIVNRDHLKLGYLRVKQQIKNDFKGGWVLRVSPKYTDEDDQHIVYIGKPSKPELWYSEVLLLYMRFWQRLGWDIEDLCRRVKERKRSPARFVFSMDNCPLVSRG